MRNKIYNCALGKGCGLVNETLALLSACDEDTTKEALLGIVRERNLLGKSTDNRTRDIITRVFYPRFMRNNPNVALWLKRIRLRGILLAQFRQLLMIYCARDNAVFYEYLTGDFADLRRVQTSKMPGDHITAYIHSLVEARKVEWSESIQLHVRRYINRCLVDFDMVTSRGEILPYRIDAFTVLYLMHELHFAGLSDTAIWNHEDWQLFALDKFQVRDAILEQSMKGAFIAQCSADLMTISWKFNSMEEFIDATLL